MDILVYLTALLKTRKTIGIVGLGTLYKKKSPGKYDTEKHAFVPPTYTLAFTKDVKEQYELANYISEQRNITIETANYYISEFAEKIRSALSEKQEAELVGIGKLKIVNNELILIPSEEHSVGFEFYGLPEIAETTDDNDTNPNSDIEVKDQLAEIIAENNLEEENPGLENVEENVLANDEQEVYEEIVEVREEQIRHVLLEESAPSEISESIEPKEEVIISEEENFEEEQKTRMPFFMKFLIAFLIIVALGAIIYFINPQFFNTYFNQNNPAQKSVTAPIGSSNNKVDSIQPDSLAKSNALVTLQKDTIATVDSSKVNIYEVIGTAESSQSSADAYIARVAKIGITAKPIRLSKRLINISLGTFLNQAEAIKFQDSVKAVLNNKDIYVKTYKPKK